MHMFFYLCEEVIEICDPTRFGSCSLALGRGLLVVSGLLKNRPTPGHLQFYVAHCTKELYKQKITFIWGGGEFQLLRFIPFPQMEKQQIIVISMVNRTLLFVVVLLVAVTNGALTPVCPAQSATTTFHQGRFTVSASGTVALVPNLDVLCYNYSLPAPFQRQPGVAVALSQLSSSPSNDLFFSIQPTKSDSLAQLTFLVRTQWKYTQWNILQVSFVAENHPHYSASTYSVDTAALAGCSSQKEVKVILPFKEAQFAAVNALAYLNGFEMSVGGPCGGGVSAFDVQVINLGVVAGGVALRVTATSAVRVYKVVVSVLAWCSQEQVIGSTYSATPLVASPTLTTQTISTVANLNVNLYGFSGFIVASGMAFNLNSQFDSSSIFTFTTSSAYSFLSYSYFFLKRSACQDCTGYPAQYQGQCLPQCPPTAQLVDGVCVGCPQGQVWNGTACVYSTPQCPQGTYWNGQQCLSMCQSGYIWNGTQCIPNSCSTTCPNGQYWNGTACVCPAGTIWNGTACVSPYCPPNYYWNGTACIPTTQTQCPSGYAWNGTACVSINQCSQCPSGYVWNGTACVSSNQCPSGYTWNGTACVSTNQCNYPTCPSGQQWNGQSCVQICSGGQKWNGVQCVCPDGQYWSGSLCVSCSNGQTWSATTLKCTCPQGTYFNGYSCVSCPSGQYWSSQTNSCSCPLNQYWNGFSCITCSQGQYWSTTSNSCKCPDGTYWNGQSCISCSGGQHWNGYQCLTCPANQQWNNANMLCECQLGYQWNGQLCILPCPQGQVSVGGLCQCPEGQYLVNNYCRDRPTCPQGQVWSNNTCMPISCPPGKYWNGAVCTSTVQNCPAGTYYDGCQCVSITTTCPTGTHWNGNSCVTDSAVCPQGYYSEGSQCRPLSCQCPPSMHWTAGQCLPIGNQCPNGTYFNGQACLPLLPCANGQTWSQSLSQCVCPTGSFWNGKQCITCGGGQLYDNGCFCPNGLFWNGSKCVVISSSGCPAISNALWTQNKCQCFEGYISEGNSCICKGLSTNGLCDRCYLKPNSEWKYGMCQCKQGYYQSSGSCLPYSPVPTPVPTSPNCNVGTFFDQQQKKCLPCSDGCLACTTCYSCTQCRPEYTFNPASQLCNEVCGDGRRFTLQCDDGNNQNGDGCSSDCKIQTGYHCTGGSPSSRDQCSAYKPPALALTLSGQSHLKNKIVLNIRANYLPKQLIDSNDCKNQCEDILAVTIVSGDKASTSIRAQYIPTTSYSFSVEIDFGREPIGLFRVEIGVKSGIALKYFSGIDVSAKLGVDVNPAFLSLYGGGNKSDVLA